MYFEKGPLQQYNVQHYYELLPLLMRLHVPVFSLPLPSKARASIQLILAVYNYKPYNY